MASGSGVRRSEVGRSGGPGGAGYRFSNRHLRPGRLFFSDSSNQEEPAGGSQPTESQITKTKCLLRELKKAPDIWSTTLKPKKNLPTVWNFVYRRAGLKDVAEAKSIYAKVKNQILYRIKKGEADGMLSQEMLLPQGVSILQQFYRTYRYEHWPEADFFARVLISKRFARYAVSVNRAGAGLTPERGRTRARISTTAGDVHGRQSSAQLPQHAGHSGMTLVRNMMQQQPITRNDSRVFNATPGLEDPRYSIPKRVNPNSANGQLSQSSSANDGPNLADEPSPYRHGIDRREYYEESCRIKEEEVPEDGPRRQSLPSNPLELFYERPRSYSQYAGYGAPTEEITRRLQMFENFRNEINSFQDREALKRFFNHFLQLSAVANQLAGDEGLSVEEVQQKLAKVHWRLIQTRYYY